MTPALGRAMGINVSSGALVSRVVPGSPAAKAGIKSGDVITEFDNRPIVGSADLRNDVAEKPPGTSVRLTLVRNGESQTVSATLEPLKATSASANAPQQGGLLSGITTGPIPQNNPNHGKVKGVYIQNVDPTSAAANAGLQQGDIITRVDRKPVHTTAELDQAVNDHKKGRPLLLRVRRGNGTLFIAVE